MLIPVITGEVSRVSLEEKRIDLNTDEGFIPGDAGYNEGPGFNMAFGLRDGSDLDPRIGTWKVEHIIKKEGVKVVRKEIPLTRCHEVCEKCDGKSDSCGWADIDYRGTGLENLYCTDAFKYKLRGDIFSKDFQYIKIGLQSCDRTKSNNQCESK